MRQGSCLSPRVDEVRRPPRPLSLWEVESENGDRLVIIDWWRHLGIQRATLAPRFAKPRSETLL
jgi:hypothetical protein